MTDVLSGSYIVKLEDVERINAKNLSDATADDSIKIKNYKKFFQANALKYLKKVISAKRVNDNFSCGYYHKVLQLNSVCCEACLLWFDIDCHNSLNSRPYGLEDNPSLTVLAESNKDYYCFKCGQ